MTNIKAAILNAGSAAWIFEQHAQRLAQLMNIEISDRPCEYNYLLGWDNSHPPTGKSFIPFESICLASDKRRLAEVFTTHQVAIPKTYLLEINSFGCADLMKDKNGNWLVLEVNTDGIFNFVDRNIDIGNISNEIDNRLAKAFHTWSQ